MLRPELVVHKSFGWNILSSIMILHYDHVKIFCDNTSTIIWLKMQINIKTKHIKIRYHFLRDHYEKGDIDIDYVSTDFQLADIFTKPLDYTRFSFICGELNVCVMESWKKILTLFTLFWCMTKRGRKS